MFYPLYVLISVLFHIRIKNICCADCFVAFILMGLLYVPLKCAAWSFVRDWSMSVEGETASTAPSWLTTTSTRSRTASLPPQATRGSEAALQRHQAPASACLQRRPACAQRPACACLQRRPACAFNTTCLQPSKLSVRPSAQPAQHQLQIDEVLDEIIYIECHRHHGFG